MFFLSRLITLLVFCLFPILLYLVTDVARNERDDSKKFFVISLILSNLLFLVFYDNDYFCLSVLINIPLVISVFRGLKFLSVYLLIVNIFFYHIILEYSFFILICEYLIYVLIYWFLNNKIKINNLLYILMLIKVFFMLSFNYSDLLLEVFIHVLIVTCSFYLITIGIFKLLDRFTDINEKLLFNKNISDEQRFKNYMFKIAHEIKNPIAVCMGYLDMMDLNDTDKIRRYFNIIKNEMNRTLIILSDGLDYSRIKVEKDIMDIVMLVEEVVDSYRGLLKGKNIKINYTSKYEELFIVGDYNRLKQVLINLIKNAIEAKDGDRLLQIDVSIKVIDKKVNVYVKDNGVGIKKEIIDNIGMDFFTTKKDGTGLGVSISKDIISKHNGYLAYDCNKGKGVVAKVMLPINCKL